MKKVFVIGAIFGIVASLFGSFVGLQMSTALGNVLMFPYVLIGKIVNIPFGEWSLFLKICGVISSIIFWGLVAVGITKILRAVKK